MTPRAVAGCGPAGLASALLLARAGHRVTLVERFDAPRALGSGLMLQPTGLAVLHRLDLAEGAVRAGARIDRLWGCSAGGRTVLDVRYAALRRPGTYGIGIHRAALFALLHDAVRGAGVPIETGRTIVGSREDRGGRRLRFADGRESTRFDLVVDALGSRSPLAPPTGRTLSYGALWASLPWPADGFAGHALEQRYRRASVMAGVLPVGTLPETPGRHAAFFWSLRLDRLDAWRAAGLDAWKQEVARLWPATQPLLDAIDDPAQLTVARCAHRTLARPAERALLHIGDAWHSASPQLGQGANMALLDAWALAQALGETSEIADALARTVALRRHHVRLYQALTRLFTPVYQSDSRLLPAVRDWVVGPLSRRWPADWIQAAMVSGLLGRPLAPLQLDRAS